MQGEQSKHLLSSQPDIAVLTWAVAGGCYRAGPSSCTSQKQLHRLVHCEAKR